MRWVLCAQFRAPAFYRNVYVCQVPELATLRVRGGFKMARNGRPHAREQRGNAEAAKAQRFAEKALSWVNLHFGRCAYMERDDPRVVVPDKVAVGVGHPFFDWFLAGRQAVSRWLRSRRSAVLVVRSAILAVCSAGSRLKSTKMSAKAIQRSSLHRL